jgi:anti-sigma regulatory factor (Ser/Thr protein kinase)
MQGTGQKNEAAAVQILTGLALPVCCAFLLGRQYGDTGIYLSFTVWNILGVPVIAAAFGLGTLFHKTFMLQKSVQNEFRCTVASLEESAAVSERLLAFCRKHGIPGRTAVHAALCAQEQADNSLTHGFKDEQRHHLEVRIALCGDGLILRVRDDGRPFDLTERYKMICPEDPLKNIGLSMIFASADEVSYSSALHLNNVCIRFSC